MAVATKSGIYNGYKVIGTQTLGLRGLVLWLKFNEGSGNIAYDSSFYNNHGTIYGATWTDGKFGKALSFDGVDDYVEVPYDASLDPSSELTIEHWIYPRAFATGVTQRIVQRAGGTWGTYLVVDSSELWFYVDTTDDGGSWQRVKYALPSTHQWYHIVGTYDGSELRLYVNGELKDSTPQSKAPDKAEGIPLNIGRTQAGIQYFNGTIDEVRIYNRALSENEIKMLYYNRIGAVPSKTI